MARAAGDSGEMTMRCASCGKGVFSAATACPFCRQPFTATLGAAKSPGPSTSSAQYAQAENEDRAMANIARRCHCYRWFCIFFYFLGNVWSCSNRSSDNLTLSNATTCERLTPKCRPASTTMFHSRNFSELARSVPSMSHNVAHSFTSRHLSTFGDGTGIGEVKGDISR